MGGSRGTSELAPDPRAQLRDAAGLPWFRREAFVLIALAVGGIATEWFCGVLIVRYANIPLLVRPESYQDAAVRTAVFFALLVTVPFALRHNLQLGFPGSPWIAAKLRGFRPAVQLRALLWPAAKLTMLIIGVSTALIAVSYALGLDRPLARNLPPTPNAFEVIILVVCMAAKACAAGICEEIAFRLGLLGLFGFCCDRLFRSWTGRPKNLAIWLAIGAQAYLFGLFHNVAGGIAAKALYGSPYLTAFALPQTFGGLFLGVFYWRKGLEASMLAHAFWDLFETFLIAILVVAWIVVARLGAH